MLIDGHQREQATDPRQSFIVQAPAGSGKTEILTQRYLRLLKTVSAPEQIIALTFTRKAANEMRERIVLALQLAAVHTKATSDHQQQTLAFATEALERDKALGWQLLQQPGRLRIITLDSLCQSLTRAIPLHEQHVPYAQISDKPETHYKTAARALFSYAIENAAFHPPLKILLQHVDNRQDNLLALFSELLAQRGQWVHLLYQAKEQDKHTYEQALSWILQHEIARFHSSIPPEHASKLIELARQLANIENKPDSPRYPLRDWYDLEQLDSHLIRNLASLILTSQDTLRKSFDHHVGLKRGECDDREYDELKAASKQLLTALEALPDFLAALLRVKKLPYPSYDSEQWEVLQSLFTLLPLLVAHLHLEFIEHNEVDFTSITEQSLMALGTDENPSDLALYLDHKIHHLLVDEFQDTSIAQFQLLTKLVQGWQENDGNTLFVVGDPMQSIYRFRSAEVGLFLRAQQQGIGPVPLLPLELSCNFRSTATIVTWINHQFQFIFPPRDDMESGAIAFHPAAPIKSADPHSHVTALQYENRKQEAQAIAHLVKTELQTHTTDTIAILVRSRRQLIDIMIQLREQQVPFQGIDIDLLSSLPHLQDVWSLTQALLMPGNRLVWLALLRSPWCGLKLSDLHSIATYKKNRSILFALSELHHIKTLSTEGHLRAQFIYTVLSNALQQRHQQPLIVWLIQTLEQLHLNHVLNASERNDIEQFWRLLERFEQQGLLEDMEQFNKEFNKLYSQQVMPSRLQIMTIHKSKGLEFDCVILPGLSTRPPPSDSPMLRWLKLPSQEHNELWLLSPIKAAHHENCDLYDYLAKLDAEKTSYELQRLLYVAATRAKKRLYLCDHSTSTSQGTFKHLLEKQVFISINDEDPSAEETHHLSPLYHLPIEYYQNPPHTVAAHSNKASLNLLSPTPRLLGIVIHELLKWVCDYHPMTIEEVPWELAFHQLRSLGYHGAELSQLQAQIQTQLIAFLNDPIGQWIAKRHEQERNEYELLVKVNHTLTTKIIDRTFFENGVRWIIDFKTGREDKHNPQHHAQVNDYASLFLNDDEKIPVHCGLYYLENQHWVTWMYERTTKKKREHLLIAG